MLGKSSLSAFRGSRFILELDCDSWDTLSERARHGGYVQGYWQSERYFAKHATAIRSDFRFKAPLDAENQSLAYEIENCIAASVHVRRGDYVTNPVASAVLGACSPNYYIQAMESLSARVPGVQYFVFSDDTPWVREVLLPRCPKMRVVENNRGDHSYNDLRLISLCRHHIIANSSFSWWGAWLREDKEGIVIAPRRWFASGPDDHGVVPADWERI
jgi:hypothetical protein